MLKHLLMLGTPNHGVPCTDPIGYGDASRDHAQTARELAPEEIALFNQYVTQRKGTKFSALVGNSVPVLCVRPQWNDGFIPEESAKHGVEDVTVTSSTHANLLSTENFAGYVRAHVITGREAPILSRLRRRTS